MGEEEFRHVPEVDNKRSLDSVEADSACFLRMLSPKSFFIGGVEEEVVFFLNFLCKFETHGCFNFSCKVSWRIRFADTTELFYGQSFVFASLVAQCMQNFTTLDVPKKKICFTVDER